MMVHVQVVKLIVVSALICAASASFQPGMRAIIFYTYDDTFSGAEFLVQKLDNTSYDSVMNNVSLTNKARSWNNAYELIALLDGRCDISMQCAYKRYTTRGPITTTTPRTTRTTHSTTPRTTQPRTIYRDATKTEATRTTFSATTQKSNGTATTTGFTSSTRKSASNVTATTTGFTSSTQKSASNATVTTTGFTSSMPTTKRV